MKKTLIIPLLLFTAAFLTAADAAVLENLGFSPDGRYFMFGEHVLITGQGQAYAEIGVVDIAKNEFVPGGWKKNSWAAGITPNQNSRGALYELLASSGDLKKRYKINHLEQGKLLYARSSSDETGEEPALSFRDFQCKKDITLTLHQETSSSAEAPSAGFYIDVTVKEPSGIEETYTVGRAGYMRSGISGYRIVRVWASPDGKALVIAVAKKSADLSIRYMVETLLIK
ncbi:MAG: hypothetical protein CSA76_06745 [Spirochaetales bacterium]|nr:MAG: hypothetical protein CSA76_06745 [Spirochaetales bacterium]